MRLILGIFCTFDFMWMNLFVSKRKKEKEKIVDRGYVSLHKWFCDNNLLYIFFIIINYGNHYLFIFKDNSSLFSKIWIHVHVIFFFQRKLLSLFYELNKLKPREDRCWSDFIKSREVGIYRFRNLIGKNGIQLNTLEMTIKPIYLI